MWLCYEALNVSTSLYLLALFISYECKDAVTFLLENCKHLHPAGFSCSTARILFQADHALHGVVFTFCSDGIGVTMIP